jgi:zinc/manganese transport system substrate-binding protein
VPESLLTRSLTSALAVGVGVLLLAGCAAGPDTSGTAGSGPGSSGPVRVVASTDVYGDIAATIGGDAVDVTSLISNPAQDPHSFQASARNQLAVSRAQVIIENGGGYDDFMGTMTSSAKTTATILNVVDISGKKADANGDLNEHVWYDLPTIAKFAGRYAAELAKADPSKAATFTANGAAFTAKLATLQAREATLRAKHVGEGVAVTEPVPLYMLNAIGLVNKTPPAFSHAIEDSTDVSPDVLKSTVDLFHNGAVKLLVYNEQTSGAETDKVIAAAKDSHVAVVPVTETLPQGKDYIGWMSANLDHIATALGQ